MPTHHRIRLYLKVMKCTTTTRTKAHKPLTQKTHTEGPQCFPSVPLDECELKFAPAKPKPNARLDLEVQFRVLTPVEVGEYIDVNLGSFSAPTDQDIKANVIIAPATGNLAFKLPPDLPDYEPLGCWKEVKDNRCVRYLFDCIHTCVYSLHVCQSLLATGKRSRTLDAQDR